MATVPYPFPFCSAATYPPPSFPGGYYSAPPAFPYAYLPPASAYAPPPGFFPAPAYGLSTFPFAATSYPPDFSSFPSESSCLTHEATPIPTEVDQNQPPPAPTPELPTNSPIKPLPVSASCPAEDNGATPRYTGATFQIEQSGDVCQPTMPDYTCQGRDRTMGNITSSSEPLSMVNASLNHALDLLPPRPLSLDPSTSSPSIDLSSSKVAFHTSASRMLPDRSPAATDLFLVQPSFDAIQDQFAKITSMLSQLAASLGRTQKVTSAGAAASVVCGSSASSTNTAGSTSTRTSSSRVFSATSMSPSASTGYVAPHIFGEMPTTASAPSFGFTPSSGSKATTSTTVPATATSAYHYCNGRRSASKICLQSPPPVACFFCKGVRPTPLRLIRIFVPEGMASESRKTVSRYTTNTVKGSHAFEISGYSLIKGIGVGRYIRSSTFNVGGEDWAIRVYPDGVTEAFTDYVTVYLELMSKDTEVRALYDLSLVNQDTGLPVSSSMWSESTPCVFKSRDITRFGPQSGWSILRSDLELEASCYVIDDYLTIECVVAVVKDSQVHASTAEYEIEVPPSDLSEHFGKLLLGEEGADVTFSVGGETFPAHKIVLATRSPVFRAELYGQMKERTARSITLEDMQPSVFRTLLHFIYTDSLPDMEHLDHDEYSEIISHLLVAADRYAMERLKLMCQNILCQYIDADSVAATLALADQHNCDRLKDFCIDFMATSDEMDTVVATQGFANLKRTCPSVLVDVLEKRSKVRKE